MIFRRGQPGILFRDYVVHPLQEFSQIEAFGGLLLLASATAAMVCANSGLSEWYGHVWELSLRVGFGGYVVDKSLHHWVNDGLMAIFFFLVGLEIKREVLAGELAVPRKALLPVVAAVGGMVVPALIYAGMTAGTSGFGGWGIPMATDIAFALGVLRLLGAGVPSGLLVFLTALAIVDDLGAVLVIALFYGGQIAVGPLLVGAAILMLSLLCNRWGIRRTLVYSVLGVVLWLAFLNSGVHATVAGILMALTIPTRLVITESQFVLRVQRLIDEFKAGVPDRSPLEREEEQQAIVQEIETACHRVEAPLQRIEHLLHPWVTFVIMPIFAFANAGVELSFGALGPVLKQPVTLGVILGLVLGKPVGVTLFTWLAVRVGLAELPAGVGWGHVYGMSWLAGIGFTMSLFIGNLAFADPSLINEAKVGILLASVLTGTVGYALLRRLAGSGT